MNVTLLTRESSIKDMENFAVTAALTCHANTDKQVDNKSFLTRIIKLGHESILEHIYLTYSIKSISRAVLQELARHRHITLSVESTRHTLKNLLQDDDFLVSMEASMGISYVFVEEYLADLQRLSIENPNVSNDVLKYFLPECWPTNLIMTTNVRELRHILDLRTAPAALKEFRLLAREMFNVVPDEFKYLLRDCIHEEVNNG